MEALDLLRAAYEPLIAFAAEVDEDTGWRATRLPGWSVRDLLFHLAADCQRALVALGTPASDPPDTDAVSYWSAWQPNTAGASAGLRGTRIIASAWSSVRGPADLYVETARAVLVLASRADPDAVIETQQRRLTMGSLLSTLAVEATVHHLDFGDLIPSPPSPAGLSEVRRILDGLLGVAVPAEFDDTRYLVVGTGRAPLSAAERESLGKLSERFPLFG
jgi:hypothetical protein